MTILKYFKAILAFLILLGGILPTTASASIKEVVSFKLNLVENGNDIVVSVKGFNLTNLYAYDLKIKYDTKQLLFKEVYTNSSGFSIDPIQANDQIRIAHTKVGKVKGEHGDLELFKLKFARIGTGDAVISLIEVKLVDSELNMVTIPAEATITSKMSRSSFKDIEGHWAEATIRQAVGLEVVNGYEDGTFRPNHELTRAEFAVMISRALKLNIGDGTGLSFADSAKIPSWSWPYVKAVSEAKFLVGYQDGSFRPGQAITREEMAAIIVRALELNVVINEKVVYTDSRNIAAWALPSVVAVGKSGIMNGRGSNRFEPKANATRAEAVSIILSILISQKSI